MTNPFKPTFTIQIEGKTLSRDITQEIMSFAFEDHAESLDLLELRITNRNLQFVDDQLFQEGNEIIARFGYVDDLSPAKKAIIKDIDYDFPENAAPTIRLKAYDKGFKLSGKTNQKVWQLPAPGILYSEIATQIAVANGLTPKVRPTKVRHLRVVQSNISDARFLQELAAKSRDRDGDGVTGYAFYIQDDELHFHPPALHTPPAHTLEYFTDQQGLLRSFRPKAQSQGAKGQGTETKAIGVDPRKKAAIEHRANNTSTPERTSLGKRTYLVDGNSGETQYKDHESGQIVPTFERTEAFHEEPLQEPAKDLAEGKFQPAELLQIEATAITIGIPQLRAKQNLEIRGVGQKFSGIYHARSVRHVIGPGGYHCELQLKKNAIGIGAGDKSDEARGRQNDVQAEPTPTEPPVVSIHGATGAQT